MTGEPSLMRRENYLRVHIALHALWTKCAGQPGYDKSMWKELDNAIAVLAAEGPGQAAVK